MKCTVVVDSSLKDDEIVIHVKEKNAICEQIERLVSESDGELLGYGDKSIFKLYPSEIYCFSIEDGKIFAFSDKGKLKIQRRLYELEAQLGENFVKINQSCLINIKKIEKFDVSLGGALRVTLKNGYRDYVSRRQLKSVKERIGL